MREDRAVWQEGEPAQASTRTSSGQYHHLCQTPRERLSSSRRDPGQPPDGKGETDGAAYKYVPRS